MVVDKKLSAQEKQQVWRNKQVQLFYGSGRPLFIIAKQTRFLRKNYDSEYYFNMYCRLNLDNGNYDA